MKTQRKNKNKLTKRSNKKNKQNKKTQKRKQSGGGISRNPFTNRLSRAKARVDSKATSLLTRGMRLDWKNNRKECEAFIERLKKEYTRWSDSISFSPNIKFEERKRLKNNYVKMELCIKINKMLNHKGISQEVKDYLNDLFKEEVCKITSQKSNRHTQRSQKPSRKRISPSRFLEQSKFSNPSYSSI